MNITIERNVQVQEQITVCKMEQLTRTYEVLVVGKLTFCLPAIHILVRTIAGQNTVQWSLQITTLS